MRRVAILLILAALLLAGGVLADGGYDLTWWTVDGGAGTSTGGGYTISGTAGQPDAGLLTGGEYKLGGGFWGGGEVAFAPVSEYYLPLALRDGP
jgi:hypothetical protein